ncbi:MAG: MFS transporter [Deltaproteobacteria bacterium]|nr:MFS transporter [Candidatus Anaeroferrophillus wilburensis]MBN2889186.1 MFS transporter [Deltaproteobacteria bacterium]
MEDTLRKFPPASLAWTIWGLGAALYLIGFFQRVAPAVMTAELMQHFQISATGLGSLSAFYFYSYVAMQTPTGILADLWGPRRLLSFGALVAGVGSFVFGVAPTFAWASLGRLLIGGSVAVAFVGMLKVASHWFAPRQYATASGLALFCGIIGAVFAGVPLRLLVNAIGWQPVMLATGCLTLLVAAAIWWVVRDDPADKGYASHAHQPEVSGSPRQGVLAGIREIFRYPNTLLLCLVPGGVVGCVLTFSGLWGVPFLTTHYGMSPAQAAALTSSLLVAWAVGGPVFGGLSDRIGKRKPLYVLGCWLVAGSWIIIIFVPAMPLFLLITMLLVAGFASGCMIIGFAFVKESVPAHLSGTVSGVCNMGVMSGPMLLQPAVGLVLDRYWGGEMINGIKIYSLTAFRYGFSLMLAWALLGCILIFFTRETNCKQHR